MTTTPIFLGFPGGSAGKESACNAGDLGLIPGLGRSPGEGKGYPLQYSGLENSMDHIDHGVAESDTTERLSLSYGIRSHQFMANRGGKSKSSDISFLGSKITVDGDCRHEIKRHLLLGRKVMTNLDSIFKSRTLLCQQTSS